ncbi:cytochrome b561 and DOMON domain-containing protein At3g07570-like [Nymphaea colorata]|nr:cytochrome b561 and DOMON domain-containing protein At3g07570-like [Nymphaea colorata]
MGKAMFLLSFVFFFLSANSQSDSCSTTLLLTPPLQFNTTSLNCQSVWSSENFLLRYAQTSPGLWSFVLSAPDTSAWFGIGFSSNGRMSGTSAVIGWPTGNGAGVIKQYYLGGYSRKAVQPDQGNLALVNPTFVSKGSTLYLAFQLKVGTPQSGLIYAVGPQNAIPASDGLLDPHRTYTSTSFSFSTGQGSPVSPGGHEGSDDDESTSGSKNRVVSGASSAFLTTKATHGLLNIAAWAVILPLGIMAARYFKHLDPTWFYAHLSLQMTGLGLAIAGVLTGISLENEFGLEVDKHKLLGFVALGLACAQATALLIRPDKKSKIRRYWNWYHHWVGRIALVIGVVNIFYGIKVGRVSKSWNGYVGTVLAVLGMLSIILEIRKCLKK